MQEKKHNWTTNLKQKIFTLTRNQLHAVKPNYHILPIKLRKKIFVIENHQGDFQGRKKKTFSYRECWQLHKFVFDNETQKTTSKSQPVWWVIQHLVI